MIRLAGNQAAADRDGTRFVVDRHQPRHLNRAFGRSVSWIAAGSCETRTCETRICTWLWSGSSATRSPNIHSLTN